jgi:2-(1,2-epoxy-1,2-dihydrophenyl)acetyl-CoA isomerase
MSVLLTEVRGRVATLTLNRPEKLNAINVPLLAEAAEIVKRWSRDSEIGAIVVTGAGRAFCAGGDVSLMTQEGMAEEDDSKTLEQKIDGLRDMQELSWLLYSSPKVTIAQVNGFAMGAGLGIALACDLRIASSAAKFGTAYAKVGYGGDFGTTWLLTHYAGAPKAKEMFFLADPVSAEEAHRIGLVNRVVEPEALAAETAALAARIAQGPLTSYRYMKANVNLAATRDFRTMLDREPETHLRCGETEDHREGVQAFLDKRAPKFTGR